MISKTGRDPVHVLLPSALVCIAIAALLLRVTAIAEPLGIDQSLWASAARAMARGQLLYRDVWEQRPPGIYWVYVAGFHLLGWKASTVAWLDLFASALTALLMYSIGRNLSTRTTGALAAAMYAAFTMPAWLYGHGGFLERAVSETFIVACISAAAWCAMQLRERRTSGYGVALGFLAGAAVIFKPNAGLYFPAFLFWIIAYTPRPVRARTVASRAFVLAILAAAVIPAIALVWLWRLGLLHDARVAVVDFNRYYVGQGFSTSSYAMDFAKAVWLRTKTEPLWVAGMIGVPVLVWDAVRRRSVPPLPGLAAIWGAAALLVIVVNGARLFNSYFINAQAPLALLGAWGLADALRGSRARTPISLAAMLVTCVLVIQRDYAGRVFGRATLDLAALGGRIDHTSYLDEYGGYGNNRGYSARANEELADYVRAHTASDDRIFLFGINGAGVYFAADRLPAHRFLRVNFFVDTDFPDPAFRVDSVIADLMASRPRYLIFEALHSRSIMGTIADGLQSNPAVTPLLSGYRREAVIEDFTLYRRLD